MGDRGLLSVNVVSGPFGRRENATTLASPRCFATEPPWFLTRRVTPGFRQLLGHHGTQAIVHRNEAMATLLAIEHVSLAVMTAALGQKN